MLLSPLSQYMSADSSHRPLAKITILDVIAGNHFLAQFGTPARGKAVQGIHWGGKYLNIGLSKELPSDLALRSLREKSQTAVSTKQQVEQRNALMTVTRFAGGHLECGKWDYVNGELTFMSHFQDHRNGTITIGHKQAILLLGSSEVEQCRIDINFHDCEDIVLEKSSIILNLHFAPKIYLIRGEDEISTLLDNLNLGRNVQKQGRKKKARHPAMSRLHQTVAGACWTYRFQLTNPADLSTIRTLLNSNGRMCSIHLLNTRVQLPDRNFEDDFERLQYLLTMTDRFGSQPFSLRFQLDRLARNGYLSPTKVSSLLPVVADLHDVFGLQPVLSAIRRLSREMPFAGPETEPLNLSLGNLEHLLRSYCAQYEPTSPSDPYELTKRYAHMNLIHKLIVTPSGLRLEGPEVEPTNRVLRSYPSATDAFIRVEFRDDDGAPVLHEARTDLTHIFHRRFRFVLDSNILICGHAFSFLGFSHSSLRSQSCWFMRPFIDDTKTFVLAELLLKRLGNFESIRTPAKVHTTYSQATMLSLSANIFRSVLRGLGRTLQTPTLRSISTPARYTSSLLYSGMVATLAMAWAPSHLSSFKKCTASMELDDC